MKNYLFEVCTNSVESCIAAQEGVANRLELCAGIPEGGTTPSYGEIAMAREVLTTIRLHVIIRPRGGDFLYSPVEVKTMLKDIEMARQLGADGVVFGCLTTKVFQVPPLPVAPKSGYGRIPDQLSVPKLQTHHGRHQMPDGK